MAACHSPANEVWCDNKAEKTKITAFHNEAVALARRYQAWWAKKPANCPPDCKIDALARQGELVGQKLGQAALLFYFEKKAAARTQ